MPGCFHRILSFIFTIFLFFSFNTAAAAVFLKSPTELVTPSELEIGNINRWAVQEQIKNKKDSFKESHKKISTDLLQLIDKDYSLPGQTRENLLSQMQKLKQFRLETSPKRGTASGPGELVYVYIYLAPGAETRSVDKYAREITGRDEVNHLVVAWVEIKNLETLASDDAVRTIRTVMPPRVNTGSVTSEGDSIHRSDLVRAWFGQDGAGIKIGVISDGVDNWTAARNSGDLPAGLKVLSNKTGGDEGTAMLEVIHDLAPGAELYFHDCGNNKVAFNQAITNLADAGCSIICDDIGWVREPFFEDGIVASHVASMVTGKNILYISSAGNDAERHYQGRYYDGGDGCHDFSEGSSDFKNIKIRIPRGVEITVVLQWDDKFGASSNDYDLYLWNSSSRLLGVSCLKQGEGSDPLEWITWTNDTASAVNACLEVYKYSGNSSNLEVFIYSGEVDARNVIPGDSVFGHPAVPGAIAVGAINAREPSRIASYSSRGPVTIRYPLPEIRNKPDICGIDGVRVTGAGGFPSRFYGTSAAAPHVAAIAALTWAQYPEKTADEIRGIILSGAVDLGAPGTDYIYGAGRADALNSILGGDTVPPAYLGAALSGDRKKVTLIFSENLTANTDNLKDSVTFAPDGTTFAPLGVSDCVTLSKNTLVATFGTALAGSRNKLRVAAGSIKDAAGNILTSTVTTEAIKAWVKGDLNGDGAVDLTDFLLLVQYTGIKQGDAAWESACLADVNNDLVINILDLLEITGP
ncbi:MAG: Extracellular serine protease precursor [Firmicutes bacterium ADurb.Bin456]|nr:MAG: Extracellular serine protease precursor [Firmicutes bacterium ADurb.Bin456]